MRIILDPMEIKGFAKVMDSLDVDGDMDLNVLESIKGMKCATVTEDNGLVMVDFAPGFIAKCCNVIAKFYRSIMALVQLAVPAIKAFESEWEELFEEEIE